MEAYVSDSKKPNFIDTKFGRDILFGKSKKYCHGCIQLNYILSSLSLRQTWLEGSGVCHYCCRFRCTALALYSAAINIASLWHEDH